MLQVIQKQNKISKKEILSAIKENRVIIYLQPIYSTKLKRITSAEVLVRISDKKGNIIYPADFIGYAEKTGLIHKIESIVFTKACEFISTNGLKTLGLDYLEINLSVKKGESVKLFKEYYEIINKYNVSPKELNLEITETSIITKRNILLNNIINLKNFGINFSLDDYGTGESNLNYIIDMPLSIIKIDKSIMDNYFNNDKARIILPNIIKMAHNIIVGQSGGPTSVINSSLAGVFATAKELGAGKIYGMRNGIEGLLEERYIDMTEYIKNSMDVEILKRTPSSFLGSCRFKLPTAEKSPETYEKIIAVLRKLDISSTLVEMIQWIQLSSLVNMQRQRTLQILLLWVFQRLLIMTLLLQTIHLVMVVLQSTLHLQ